MDHQAEEEEQDDSESEDQFPHHHMKPRKSNLRSKSPIQRDQKQKQVHFGQNRKKGHEDEYDDPRYNQKKGGRRQEEDDDSDHGYGFLHRHNNKRSGGNSKNGNLKDSKKKLQKVQRDIDDFMGDYEFTSEERISRASWRNQNNFRNPSEDDEKEQGGLLSKVFNFFTCAGEREEKKKSRRYK